MNDEKLVRLMSESRLVAASENVIFPMIKQMIQLHYKQKLLKIYGYKKLCFRIFIFHQ
mgnify:CR=1 FL=1